MRPVYSVSTVILLLYQFFSGYEKETTQKRQLYAALLILFSSFELCVKLLV